MMEDDLKTSMVRLEELYSHQQHYINQLNDALIAVRKEMEQLKRTVSQQKSQIDWLTENQDAIGPANEKPPHY